MAFIQGFLLSSCADSETPAVITEIEPSGGCSVWIKDWFCDSNQSGQFLSIIHVAHVIQGGPVRLRPRFCLLITDILAQSCLGSWKSGRIGMAAMADYPIFRQPKVVSDVSDMLGHPVNIHQNLYNDHISYKIWPFELSLIWLAMRPCPIPHLRTAPSAARHHGPGGRVHRLHQELHRLPHVRRQVQEEQRHTRYVTGVVI